MKLENILLKQILLENKSYLDIKSLKIKLNWSQAKDDIGPKDIFRLQKGSSSDRAIIGKYCIKDCELVNILVSKLEILTNNIGMANVCSVPLNYIFTRGQGIKIFSLVSKKCNFDFTTSFVICRSGVMSSII